MVVQAYPLSHPTCPQQVLPFILVCNSTEECSLLGVGFCFLGQFFNVKMLHFGFTFLVHGAFFKGVLLLYKGRVRMERV